MMKKLVILLLLCFGMDICLASGEYGFSCWENGWRKNGGDGSADLFCIETSEYGFVLDLDNFSKVRFGKLNRDGDYEQALNDNIEQLHELTVGQLVVEIIIDGQAYQAKTCKAGKDKAVGHLGSARLWEAGRYVQHYDFLELDFQNNKGEKLDFDGTLDLVAWPGSLTFNMEVAAGGNCDDAKLKLGLNSWKQEENIKGTWRKGEKKNITLNCNTSGEKVPEAKISVKANGRNWPVSFENKKNCYVVKVERMQRKWATGYTDIRNYDDFEIKVESDADGKDIPFLLELRNPANITGLCPILCDQNGRPLGVPVQLSKNWHEQSMGAYMMAYTMLPAKKQASYILRVIYGFYGTLPTASHSQLSLVGYGKNIGSNNGRWEQLAIGCWGETICFDMDMSCVDVAITDIRMLMTRNAKNGKKWSWTDAGWGGDWLNIADAGQKKYFMNHMKTAYLAHGPCLTDVRHDGYYGSNQEIKFSAQIQTLRTDDYNRVFQKLTYEFMRDVKADKLWLFKLGRTNQYTTPQIAYGNINGCSGNLTVPAKMKRGQLFLDNVEIDGDGPWWVGLPGAVHTSGKDWGTGYRALIIRGYKVVAGGKVYSQPVISAPAFGNNPANLDIELSGPIGVNNFKKGDIIELDLELITLPRVADDYYGPNDAFRRHLTENPSSWKSIYREVKGNDLEVTVAGGKLLQKYPIIIECKNADVKVTIKGGVGAVPIRFEGLKQANGYNLYRVVNGKRVKLDQSVHGNDYWQVDYEEHSGLYKMSFNLELDGLEESDWILAR
ncbi:MAG: hypothetical protein JEZ07_10890 [Phycisphaerae bacterium]|nr:hypothetical protein [Phycisphaerae bacterium]